MLTYRYEGSGAARVADVDDVLGVCVTRYLVSDLLQFRFVGDALEVVAGRVRPFEGGEFLSGEFDVEGGDRVVDLGDRVGTDEGRRDDWLAVQPGQAIWALVTPRPAAMVPTASMIARSASAVSAG